MQDESNPQPMPTPAPETQEERKVTSGPDPDKWIREHKAYEASAIEKTFKDFGAKERQDISTLNMALAFVK